MDAKRFSAWVDVAVLSAIFAGATFFAGVCMAALATAAPSLGRGPVLFAVYTVQFAAAIAGGVAWLRSRGGVRLSVGVNWADSPSILGGLVVVTAASVVIEPLLGLFPDRYFEQLGAMVGRGGWAILLTVVAAPLLEEIFFRGIVLEGLSRRWSASAAVVASALLFGAAHVPNPPQMINAFVVAVVMGYLYLSRRSLIPVIAIHAINNALAYMILATTGSQNTDIRTLVGNDSVYRAIYAMCVLVVAVSLVVMRHAAGTKRSEFTFHKKTTGNESL